MRKDKWNKMFSNWKWLLRGWLRIKRGLRGISKIWCRGSSWWRKLPGRLTRLLKNRKRSWISRLDNCKLDRKHFRLSSVKNKILLNHFRTIFVNFKTNQFLRIPLILSRNWSLVLIFMICVQQMVKMSMVDLQEKLEMIHAENYLNKIYIWKRLWQTFIRNCIVCLS